MASSAVCLTPVKNRSSVFNTRTAGGRIPLTPSPRTPRTQTPDVQAHESIHGGNFMARIQRSVSKTTRDSPKSNIARNHTPRKLELGVSEWSLTGTGTNASSKAATKAKKEKKEGVIRARPTKTRITYNAADRFIPNRTASEAIRSTGAGKLDVEQRPKSSSKTEGSAVLANAASAFDLGGRGSEEDITLSLEGLSLDDEEEEGRSRAKPAPGQAAYQSTLASACDINTNTRILAFKPAPPESSKPIDLRTQYNRPSSPPAPRTHRAVVAFHQHPSVSLTLPVWSMTTTSTFLTGPLATKSPLVSSAPSTSVKWSGDGAYVGVGLGTGEVQIWDVEEQTKLRSMFGHETRVGVMGWNKHILSTGARSGLVYNHDVRIAQHKIAELVSHTGEVCGLEWRADGAQLATGANDNMVNIWDARALAAPKFTKTNHRAAVKAVSWCPWQSNLLATGGGSNDRQIYFWNTTTGARINHIPTDSQVTSLRWSTHYKEIVSTGGFPDNSLSIWSYPSGVKNMEVPAHESRVLHSCLSPDGQMLATAAADESLKFWKIFEKKPGQPSVAAAGSASMKPSATKQMTIR
ncbi:hypothetical protein P3342_013465 [Pyrenophora teres f. teres]|nr:hypothetical protein P3342_013465 [Pyrenophora teres f. teres]